MFKFVSIVVIQAAFALTIQGSDSDEVCLATWRKREGVHSIGAIDVTGVIDPKNVISLTKCLIYCQSTVDCLAVDYNHLTNSCWMHSDPAYNSSDSIYDDDPAVSQYSLDNCASINVSKEECPSSWHTSTNKSSSSNYTELGLANISSCFSYCRFTDSCNGIAFDSTSWPFCKVFSSFDFADPLNLIENPSSTIYLFDKKECIGNPNNKSYARCIGQTFPQISQWCPEGSNVAITSLNYRDNPFCCKDVLQRNIYPLDNGQLATFNLDFFNSNYSDSIRNCTLNRSCLLRAEINKFFVSKSVCLTDEKGPNSVSISFTCSKLQIDATTNLSTSTSLLPSASFPVYTFDPKVLPETTFPILTQPSRIFPQHSVSLTNSLSSPSSTSSNAITNSLSPSSSSSPTTSTDNLPKNVTFSPSPSSTFPLPKDALSSPSSTSSTVTLSNAISNSLSPSPSSSPSTDATSTTSTDSLPKNVTFSPSPSSTFPLPTDALSSPSSTSSPFIISNTMSISLSPSSSPSISTTSMKYDVTPSNSPENFSMSPTAYPAFSTTISPPISLPPKNATTSTSPETSTVPSTNAPATNKENKERTALILGALGTSFGLFSLLLLVLLVVLLCRNLHNNGNDIFDTFSWKTIMHGSSNV